MKQETTLELTSTEIKTLKRYIDIITTLKDFLLETHTKKEIYNFLKEREESYKETMEGFDGLSRQFDDIMEEFETQKEAS